MPDLFPVPLGGAQADHAGLRRVGRGELREVGLSRQQYRCSTWRRGQRPDLEPDPVGAIGWDGDLEIRWHVGANPAIGHLKMLRKRPDPIG